MFIYIQYQLQAVSQHGGLLNHIALEDHIQALEDHIHYLFDLGSTLPQRRPLHTHTLKHAQTINNTHVWLSQR